MPQNKIQHYVPKCHLRPFSSNGAAINLYNIGRQQMILGAPIKGQCARPYFYGQNGELERALQGPEGNYATIVAKASREPNSLNLVDLVNLREFTLLQIFRTFGYVEKLMDISEQFRAEMARGAVGMPLGTPMPPPMFDSVEGAVIEALRHFVHARAQVRDLETCLIINRSRRAFITSDDPAIHTNRFHFQRLKKESFGLGSAGAMFFLPLTPTIGFMAFDGNVYFVPERRGNTVEIMHDDDASCINELQVLHARQNLYYAAATAGESVAAECLRHAANRPKEWNNFSYFEKVGQDGKREIFQRVKGLELEPGRQFIASFGQAHVKPIRWTSLLQYRLRPRYVDTGTGAGYMRLNHPALRERR